MNVLSNRRIKKNSLLLAIIQFVSVFTTFLLVPLFLKFLKESEYGIWLTIFSTITWINVLDLGVSNGLRNKLTESFTHGDNLQIKRYIGSALAFFSIILFFAYGLFYTLSSIVDYRVLFNALNYDNTYFFKFLNIIFISIILDFMFKILDSVAYAMHNSFIPKLRVLLKNLFLLIGLYWFLELEINDNRLLNLSIIYFIISLGVNIFFSIVIFAKKENIIPSFKVISFADFKPLGTIGIKFFIIQLSALVIFSTDNFIIINFIGSEEVTQYNIVFKLFSFVILAQSFLTVPLWSAYTAKYNNKDYKWIKKAFNKSIYYSILLGVFAILLLFSGKFILRIWLNNDSYFELPLAFAFLCYTFARLWNGNFATLLNGIGVLNFQMITAIIGAIINIPLSIFFAKNLGLGISGVIMASTVSLLIFSVFAPFEFKKYIYKS